MTDVRKHLLRGQENHAFVLVWKRGAMLCCAVLCCAAGFSHVHVRNCAVMTASIKHDAVRSTFQLCSLLYLI